METEKYNAEQIALKLQFEKLPIENIIVYTAETDRNKLLGRPGQYTSKVNFADSRLQQPDPNDPVGGSIEVFNNAAELKDRKEYIESLYLKMPALTEYMVVNGNYLLRLSNEFTPSQADEYKTLFMKIK